MSYSSRGTRHTPSRPATTGAPPPPLRRSSTATEYRGKTSDAVVGYVPLPMLTPAPTPVRTLFDYGAGQAGPLPRLQRSLTTGGATRGQMSPWAHHSSDQHQQRAGAPPPLLLLDSVRLRNVSPYHLSQRSPAVVERRTPTAQYSSQFLARSLAASPASSWAQSPQRSLSRRQSIVLQSSCSGHLSIESPNRDHQYSRGAAVAVDPQSLASTKSLPHGPPNTVVDAQRSRRRSMAYERYPPLVSIFEASAALSLAYDDDDGGAEQYSEGEGIQAGPSTSVDYDGRIVRRTPSASSLASAFSALSSSSSSSSSSSAASSYSYLFGTGRPSAAAISSDEQPAARKFDSVSSYRARGPHKRDIGHRPSITASIIVSSAGDFCFGTMTDAAAGQLPQQLPLPTTANDNRLSFLTERGPLLGGDSSATLSADNDDWRQQQQQSTSSMMVGEAGSLVRASSYLMLGNLLQAVISISQVASSGHLGTRELAAIGLAHIVVILTGYLVAFAVLGCLETCASQAFTSARPQLVGGYFVRAIQLQWIMGLLMAPLWLNAAGPLSYLLDDSETVALAAEYLRWYFVPFQVFANLLCAKQVLYAQGITYPAPYLTLLGALTTMGFQYLFVFSAYFQLGVRGIAAASGLSYLAMLAATLVVIGRHDVKRIRGPPAPWSPMLRLLPHCMALSLFSTGTSELVTVAAAHLGPAALTTQAVLSALSRVLSITSSSIGVAALNRSGNLIGQHAIPRARAAALTALCAAALVAGLALAALLAAPQWWIRIFTSDRETAERTVGVLPIVALAFAAQAMAFVASQLLAAQGRQSLAVRIKFVSLYVVAVPLAYYWVFVRDHGLAGLWAAVALGQLATGIAESLVVLRTNWPRLLDKCAYIVHN